MDKVPPKKILIVCDLFPPAFGPRMGYLCKYLDKERWQPTVITETTSDETFSFLTGYAPVEYVRFYKAKSRIIQRVEWLACFIGNLLFDCKDRKLYKNARKLLGKEKIDLVLCSTYRTFPLKAAAEIAKKYNVPLVADLRDIIEQYAGNEYIARNLKIPPLLNKIITKIFRWQSLKKRNKVLRKADSLTTVSAWHVQTLKKYNDNVRLIYNGYDPEIFYPEQKETPQFFVTYTGRILSLAMRDPSLLFEAVKQLSHEKKIVPEKFRIRWYVDETSQNILKPVIQKYRISEYMDYLGYVPASEIPSVLNHSSVLLQLANKSDESGPKGIMTTKIFEAIAVGKPLLCVRSDEGCLRQIIEETRSGIAAETVEEVKEFLIEKYQEWQRNHYTTVTVDRRRIEKYSRATQAKQFMEIFDQLVTEQESRKNRKQH